MNFYLSFECEFVLLFPSPFLFGIKLVPKLRLLKVLISMAVHGRRAKASSRKRRMRYGNGRLDETNAVAPRTIRML